MGLEGSRGPRGLPERGQPAPRGPDHTPLRARSVDARRPGSDGSGQRVQSSPDEPEPHHHTVRAGVP